MPGLRAGVKAWLHPNAAGRGGPRRWPAHGAGRAAGPAPLALRVRQLPYAGMELLPTVSAVPGGSGYIGGGPGALGGNAGPAQPCTAGSARARTHQSAGAAGRGPTPITRIPAAAAARKPQSESSTAGARDGRKIDKCPYFMPYA